MIQVGNGAEAGPPGPGAAQAASAPAPEEQDAFGCYAQSWLGEGCEPDEGCWRILAGSP